MHILQLLATGSSIPILILLITGSMLPNGPIISVDNAYAISIMHFRQLGVSVEHPLFTRKKSWDWSIYTSRAACFSMVLIRKCR